MGRQHVIARESLWGTIVTYVGVAIGFLTTFFVLTTYLTPEEVGLTRLLVEVATLLSGLGMLGLSTSISRYYPYFRDDDGTSHEEIARRGANNGFLYWILSIAAIGLLITLPLFVLARGPISTLFGAGSELLDRFYYAIAPLTACLVVWTVVELYTVQMLRLAVPKVIRELVLRLLLLASYLIYAMGWVDLMGFIALFVGSYGLCMVLSIAYLGRISSLSLRHDTSYITPELRRGFVRYTLLAILSIVGTTLAGRMDLFMLAIVDGEGLRSAAVFSIGFFMVSIVEIPTRAIISIATARIASTMKQGDLETTSRLYERVARYQLLAGIVIYAGLFASIDEIISLMPNGTEYRGSVEVFIFLGLAKLIEVTFTACHPIISTSRYYHWSLYYTLWLCVVAFVANRFLIPMWGPMGAAMATLITTIVGYGLLQWLLYRRLGIHPFSLRLFSTVGFGLVLVSLPFIYMPTLESVYLTIGLRSLIVAVIAVGGILTLRIAPEALELVRTKLSQRRV